MHRVGGTGEADAAESTGSSCVRRGFRGAGARVSSARSRGRAGAVARGRASSRSTPTRRSSRVLALRGDGCANGTSWWCGRAMARPGRTRAATSIQGQRYASNGSARGRGVPGQHLHDGRPGRCPRWRRMPTATSSWCGTATARPGRTPAATASRASATPRTDRRGRASSRSIPTRPSCQYASLRGGGVPTGTSSWCG